MTLANNGVICDYSGKLMDIEDELGYTGLNIAYADLVTSGIHYIEAYKVLALVAYRLKTVADETGYTPDLLFEAFMEGFSDGEPVGEALQFTIDVAYEQDF